MTALGLLLATMEPPAGIEEEFQDWYDTEHFPERRDCDGFVTAGRWVCIDGFPRYLALYDLADPDVLSREGYARIAVRRYSPWTHRIMAKVWGQYRATGTQLFPGAARMGDQGLAARIVVMRFHAAPAGAQAAVLDGLHALYRGNGDVVQYRLFRAEQADGLDFVAITELRGPLAAPGGYAAFGDAARYLDLVNTYVPYRRASAGSFPARS